MKTKTKTRWPSTMTVSEFQERIAAQVAGRAPLPRELVRDFNALLREGLKP